MSKRILFINSGIEGSTGSIMLGLCEMAENFGYQTFYAYGCGEIGKDPRSIWIGDKPKKRFGLYRNYLWSDNVRLHFWKSFLLDMHGLGSKKATIEFIKKIEILSPDIIHIHNLHGYYINYEILFSYLATSKIPIIWTLHDCWPFTGHCASYQLRECSKWVTGCKHCPMKKEYPTSLIVDQSENNYKKKRNSFNKLYDIHFIALGKWMRDNIEDSFLNSGHIHVIPNGVDNNKFFPIDTFEARKVLGLPFNRFIILGVAAGLTQEKGLKYFLELSKVIEKETLIVLVGMDHNAIEALPENILGFPRTNNTKELSFFYNSADVFLTPSEAETAPLVILEAFSCGTPVIGFATGCIPDMVNEDCGFVVDRGDIKGLLHAVTKVRNKGKDSYKLNCRNYSLTRNKEYSFKKTVALYDSIVGK